MSETFDGITIQNYLPIRMDVDAVKNTRRIWCLSCGQEIGYWGPAVGFNRLALDDFLNRCQSSHVQLFPTCVRRRIVRPE